MVESLDANFLQSPLWAEANRKIGHQVEWVDSTLCIIKDARRGRYMEVPGGPLMNWQDSSQVHQMIKALRALASAKKCAFVRLRPQLLNTPTNLQMLKELGLRPSPMHLHAEHTVMIDLTKTEEELLAAMRRQTRYEVRRAEKLKIRVAHFSAEGFDYQKFISSPRSLKSDFANLLEEFYEAQQKTAARQNFIPPSRKELAAEAEAFRKNATLYIAKTADGQPIAYGLILGFGQEADYFEAASTDLNRKLPGAYAILWQAMKDLKAAGFARFNLWGIAPPGQPNHRYAKVTTFKTGFGGEIVNFVPAHDLVISKIKYLPDFIIETARKRRRHLG